MHYITIKNGIIKYALFYIGNDSELYKAVKLAHITLIHNLNVQIHKGIVHYVAKIVLFDIINIIKKNNKNINMVIYI